MGENAWVNNYISGQANVHQGHNHYYIGNPKSKEDECKALLHSVFDYEKARDRVSTKVPGTWEWVLHNPEFLSWRDSKTSRVLWVTAEPGCGKSVLCRALADPNDDDFVAKAAPNSTVSSFFFNHDNGKDGTDARVALCSLLHQIFIDKPDLIKYAMPNYDKHGSALRTSLNALWEILESLAKDASTGPIVCVIDALDECERKSRKELIHLVMRFVHERGKHSQLKFIMTSRPYHEIEVAFHGFSKENLDYLNLGDDDALLKISSDIEMFINKRVADIYVPLRSTLSAEFEEGVIKELKKNKNHTYLWVTLVLEDLEQSPKSDLDDVASFVEQLPQSVEKAYHELLGRIMRQDQYEAKTLFQLILAARRPLLVQEMNAALAVAKKCSKTNDQSNRNSQANTHSNLDLKSDTDFIRHIKNLTGSFVRVSESRIYFIHQTARDFLSDPTNLIEEYGTWVDKFEPREAESVLAETCIRTCIGYLQLLDFKPPEPVREYLQLCDLSRGGKLADPSKIRSLGYDLATKVVQKPNAFLKYAADTWYFHYRKANFCDNNENLLPAVTQLCDVESLSCFVPHTEHPHLSGFRLQGIPDTLWAAVRFGITPVIQTMIQTGQAAAILRNYQKNGIDGLFSVISSAGFKDVQKLLFDICEAVGGVVVASGLKEAAKCGNLGMVRRFTSRGGVEKNQALQQACYQGHLSVIKYLVEEADTKVDNTSLHHAAMGFQTDVIRLLVEQYGMKADAISDGITPLSATLKDFRFSQPEACFKTVKVLLELGHDPTGFYCRSGESMLEMVVKYGNEEFLDFLIKIGLDPNITLVDGRGTLMHVAASLLKWEMLDFLLDFDVDVNKTDKDGITLLSTIFEAIDEVISWGGSPPPNAIKYVTRLQAQINTKDKSGSTPLAIAATIFEDVSILEHLLKLGADFEEPDKDGGTPLMKAAEWDSIEAVKLLVQKGPDINKTNQNGKTALHIASESGSPDVYCYLLDKGADRYYLERNEAVPPPPPVPDWCSSNSSSESHDNSSEECDFD